MNAIVKGQLVPAMRVGQAPVTEKSGALMRFLTCRVVLPVFERVRVCGEEASPPRVEVKLSDPWKGCRSREEPCLEGTATTAGVTVPVRSMKSGLETASLSMTTVPVSVLNGAGEELAAT